MGRGSAGASIWLSWKSPWPVICTSLLTCRGQPRIYPDTQRLPNPVAGPPVPFWLVFGIYVALWASRCERRERKPSRLCFCADRCLSNSVASCSLSTGKRRASGKWDSTKRESALRESARFFTARSATPWHTSAAGQRGRRIGYDLTFALNICAEWLVNCITDCFQSYLTMTWQPLGKEAGQAVLSIAVPTFSRLQHKHQTVCNLRHIQEWMHINWIETKDFYSPFYSLLTQKSAVKKLLHS